MRLQPELGRLNVCRDAVPPFAITCSVAPPTVGSPATVFDVLRSCPDPMTLRLEADEPGVSRSWSFFPRIICVPASARPPTSNEAANATRIFPMTVRMRCPPRLVRTLAQGTRPGQSAHTGISCPNIGHSAAALAGTRPAAGRGYRRPSPVTPTLLGEAAMLL